jgi:transposase-like protein
MARRQLQKLRADLTFKGRQLTPAVILWTVRWYLMFPISYRDLELMLQDRGVGISHTSIFRWTGAYAPEMEKRSRPHLCKSNGSWRVDETYVRVKGRWTYLYRAVGSCGQTIDFLLCAHRDAGAAKRFFRKALGQPHRALRRPAAWRSPPTRSTWQPRSATRRRTRRSSARCCRASSTS